MLTCLSNTESHCEMNGVLTLSIDYPEDRDWKRYCFTRVAYATSVIRLYVLVTTVTNLEITAKMHFFINKGENLTLISVFLYS